LIAPFLLRRTKEQVASELPLKIETTLRISFSDEQRGLYESLRLALSREVRTALEEAPEHRSALVVLSALLRLRQVCCDPRLLGDRQEQAYPRSAKLDALMTLVKTLRDERRKVVIFSQFTSMLELIAQELRDANLAYVELTGETADRRKPVQSFQQSSVGIFLASLKAGGVGLNLTAADAVIHYDPWWNPAVERQATDRAHRLGREQPVFVYQLICEDTIEEKINSLKADKSELAKSVLDGERSLAVSLSAADIRQLFDVTPAH